MNLRGRCVTHSVMSDFLECHGRQPARILCPWDFPGENIGVGYHFLLQRIFPTQGWSPGLLAWQADSLPPEPPGTLCHHKSNIHHHYHSLLETLPSFSWLPGHPVLLVFLPPKRAPLLSLLCWAPLVCLSAPSLVLRG